MKFSRNDVLQCYHVIILLNWNNSEVNKLVDAGYKWLLFDKKSNKFFSQKKKKYQNYALIDVVVTQKCNISRVSSGNGYAKLISRILHDYQYFYFI